jgi:hypothetical protein
MAVTLITHFYNERFLLPYFIAHHRPLFSHAVFIDYHSTDDSVELIRDLWPGAEVRTTRNPDFAAIPVDREVMDIEREFSGWKIALNTTEFLFHPDLEEAVAKAPRMRGLAFNPVVMIDRPEERHRELDPDLPLYLQCRHGVRVDPKADPTFKNPAGRSLRYLHPWPDGAYGPGRHQTGHPFAHTDAYYLWFGWAPIEQVKARKLQIQTQIPDWDRRQGHGHQHFLDAEQLEATYLDLAQHTTELWKDPVYKAAMDRFYAAHPG